VSINEVGECAVTLAYLITTVAILLLLFAANSIDKRQNRTEAGGRNAMNAQQKILSLGAWLNAMSA
jgi:hypothetical protein